MIAQGDFYLLI